MEFARSWFGVSARACAAAMCVLSVAQTLSATVIVPADLGELARDARAVAQGRVVATDAQWTPGRRTIETMVTLEVDAYLKGSLGETVQFRVPGGVLGRYRNIVMGAPQFVVGQRVIVFLGSEGPSIPFVLGLSQGVFRIVQTAGATMVQPPPMLPGAVGPVVRGSAARAPQTLAAFAAEVRSLSGGAR